MSEGVWDLNGAFELARLNRVLAQLARPGPTDEWLAPMTLAELIDVGVFAGGRAPQRKQIIERLWSRKRQLLRQARGLEPPVA